jgi:hypothetical protein
LLLVVAEEALNSILTKALEVAAQVDMLPVLPQFYLVLLIPLWLAMAELVQLHQV